VEKNEALPKTSKWTYGFETERTVQSIIADVRSECDMGLYFHQPSHSSCFPCFKVILVEIRVIEGFPQIWRTWIIWNSRKHYSIQVSFNSHNAQCYFPCTA
jgi:hypothetical protein